MMKSSLCTCRKKNNPNTNDALFKFIILASFVWQIFLLNVLLFSVAECGLNIDGDNKLLSLSFFESLRAKSCTLSLQIKISESLRSQRHFCCFDMGGLSLCPTRGAADKKGRLCLSDHSKTFVTFSLEFTHAPIHAHRDKTLLNELGSIPASSLSLSLSHYLSFLLLSLSLSFVFTLLFLSNFSLCIPPVHSSYSCVHFSLLSLSPFFPQLVCLTELPIMLSLSPICQLP